ncbi:MAG: hypothetical protein ACE3L7_21255 [Candidatus Pristimantibacillus sp.]
MKLVASATAIALCLIMSTGCANNTNDSNAAKGTDTPAITNPANNNEDQVAPSTSPDATEDTSPVVEGNPFEVAGITDPAAFLEMFKTVKETVAADDKEKLAEYVLYPLAVNGPKPLSIENKEQLIEQYDSIFTASVKEALANQNEDDLFVNYKGVMVGNGAIWFGVEANEGEKEKYGIIAVNLGTE